MLLSDATLAHAGGWLLAQVATLPDTIVTRQVPIQGTWFDQLQAVLRALMTLAILVLTVAVVPAAWNFRKSYQKISDLLDRVYADVNPITHHASRIAENIDYVSTALRADVQRASATLTDANERLQEALRHAEARARDFDALLAVVQEETEGAFVSTASAARGVRTGMQTLRDVLQLTLRDARRAALYTEPAPPAAGGTLIARAPEPAGPATYAALDELVDDEVEEPLLDDDMDLDDLDEEEPRHGEWSEHETARQERPRVRPRRGGSAGDDR